jgi:ribosome assembly protein YihI (activator of Der GTPase)
MQEEPVFLNTVLPLFFYDLINDMTEDRDVPKSKGFGSNDLTKMLPKDKRLQALLIVIEIGKKLDAYDKHVHAPGQRWTDPYIEDAIRKFSLETGIPEDDLRQIIKRPRLNAGAEPGQEPLPEPPHVLGVVDP